MYVAGVTNVETMVIAKFDNVGHLVTGFGSSGIAQTTVIPALTDGGAVALDSNLEIVIDGYTSNHNFVVAKFLATGLFDPAFGSNGIAFTNSLSSLNSCPAIAVDINNNILVGGTSTAYDGVSNNMVVARLTSTGAIDYTIGTNGFATTNVIPGLTVGSGFVAVNGLDNAFVGGFDGLHLIVAEMYSGAEIFIANPAVLSADAFAIYWYGNNPSYYQDFLTIDFYAAVITDPAVRLDVVNNVLGSLAIYVSLYEGQPNLNLVANLTPGWDGPLHKVNELLDIAHAGSASQIDSFFASLHERIVAIRAVLSAFSVYPN